VTSTDPGRADARIRPYPERPPPPTATGTPHAAEQSDAWLRRRVRRALLALVVAASGTADVGAQPLPEFTLPPPSFTLDETLENVRMVRGSEQALLVATGGRSRGLLRVDLADGRVEEALSYDEPDGFRSIGPLWSWRGDSLAFIDRLRGELLVFAPDGTLARRQVVGDSAANRRPRLPALLALVDTSAALGPGRPAPANDATGRPRLSIQRYDFARRRARPVTTYPGPLPGAPPQMSRNSGTMTMTMPLAPVEPNDSWAAFSDGTVALVRGATYVIQLVPPTGPRRLLPSLAVQRVPFTDKRRKAFVETTERAIKAGLRRSGQQARIGNLVIKEPETFPDSLPHFSALTPPMVDPRDRLWIPVFCAGDDEATCFDVVDRKGQRHVRIRLERETALAGFTPAHAIIVVESKGKQRLELRALP
jgi:hypothetical protein